MGEVEGNEVSSTSGLDPFLEPLAALQNLIDKLNGRGLIMGGIAASLLGKPRLTADLDAMVLASIREIPNLLLLAQEVGLTARIEDAEEFARNSRVLLLEHQESGIPVDISLGVLPLEIEAVERSQIYEVGTLRLRLPSPEDLIIFKAVAHRPKDLVDIQAIVENYSNLDRDRIRMWVKEFAEVLDMPELLDDIDELI